MTTTDALTSNGSEIALTAKEVSKNFNHFLKIRKKTILVDSGILTTNIILIKT